MNTFEAIENRRSIRKFKDTDIPNEVICKIIEAGIKAPSAKNKQPWKFIITKGVEKDKIIAVIEQGVETEKNTVGLLPNRKNLIPAVLNTIKAMKQAPVLLFVFNTEETRFLFQNVSTEEKFVETSNLLSIGASIQNILLAATDLGIASLWICDTVFAYKEICSYFCEKGQLVSAVSLGYSAETPLPIAKKDFNTVVFWRGEPSC
ncbi:MAG: nitroreductase family protein [Oscillospiraceae bacterium]|nr:nitroreductase family protein [Oscillospiraceae bacterium]